MSEDRRCTNGGSGTRTSDAGANSKPLRVLLVEADQDVARAVVRDFGRGGVAVTMARTLAEARAALRQGSAPVDVVVLALRLPDGKGESLLPDIEACPRQPAVIITSAFLQELQSEALEYRPVAMAKPVSTVALLRMVRTVAGGYIRPFLKRFVERFDLSKREAEVIALLARGRCAKEIASHLSCSEKTIYFHLTRVCEKTNCRHYHEVTGRLFTFACQCLGHTPPEHTAVASPGLGLPPGPRGSRSQV